MATQLAFLYLLDCGSGERPIDFQSLYRSSWLGVGIMSKNFLFDYLYRFFPYGITISAICPPR